MAVRLSRFWISSRRDIIVIDDSTRDRLFLRDLDPLAGIFPIIDPPFLREAKHSIKVSALVLAESRKGCAPCPQCYSKFQVRIRVALECLADVVKTVHCVLVSLACRIAILGGEVIHAYLILVAGISKAITR